MQAEAELAQQRQLEYKDQFLSHVSHELRSPLFAIYQFVTIVLDNLAGELQPAQRQYLEIVLRNVKQLQSMIDDLLEVTRVQAGKMAIDLQCASVEEAIHFVVDTLQAAATAKHITLSAELEPPLPPVWADPKRIRQSLIILVDNAIKFTPVEGWVKVKAHTRGDPQFVTMEVADSGPGINPEIGDRVFDRLFQIANPAEAGRKGLGLGLHICKELITRQGGTIRVGNDRPNGAVFTATLPVFSLARIIAPALCEKGNCEQPFTLLVIEAGSNVGWVSDEVRTETCNSIRETLQHCVYYDCDILLPRMAAAGDYELFFLMARTEGVGADAMSKRILKQLHDPEHIEYADLTFAITHRPLTNIGRRPEESLADCSQRSTETIHRIMDEELSLRVARRG